MLKRIIIKDRKFDDAEEKGIFKWERRMRFSTELNMGIWEVHPSYE